MNKSSVAWADLLRMFKHLPAAQWSAAAQAAGFAALPAPPPPASEPPPAPPLRTVRRPPRKPPALPPAPPAAAAPLFWRLLSDDPNPSAQVETPGWLTRAAGTPDAAFQSSPGTQLPAAAPLVPASRLANLLRRELARTCSTQALDVPWAVRRLASGQALTRLRRQQQRRWPARVDVVVQSSPELGNLPSDLHAVARQVQAQMGQRARVLEAGSSPHRLVDPHTGQSARLRRDGTAVLVLGDAGSYSGLGNQANTGPQLAWQQVAQGLARHAHIRPLLWAPLPLRLLPAATAALFDVVLLDDSTHLRRATAQRLPPPMPPPAQPDAAAATAAPNAAPSAAGRSPGLRALLAVLAGVACVPPALLRLVRRALQSGGMAVDVGTEAEVLADREALVYNGAQCAVRAAYLPQALADAAGGLPGLSAALRDSVRATLWAALQHLSPLQRAEYTHHMAAQPVGDAALAQALQQGRTAGTQLFEALAARQRSGSGLLDADLAHWVLGLHQRHAALVQASAPLQAAVALARGVQDPADLPAGFDAAALQWLFDPAQSAVLRVRGAAAGAAGQASAAQDASLLCQPWPARTEAPPGLLVRGSTAHVSVRSAVVVADAAQPSAPGTGQALGLQALGLVIGQALQGLWLRPEALRSREMRAWLQAGWRGPVPLSEAPLRAALAVLRPLWRAAGEPSAWQTEQAVHTLWAGLDRALWLQARQSTVSDGPGQQPPTQPDTATSASAPGITNAAAWATGLGAQFPPAWLPAGSAMPPQPADKQRLVRLAHAAPEGERLRLQAPWPHRVDMGQRTLWLDALSRPAWAQSIETEGSSFYATLPGGRRLVWVPATPRALSGGAGTYRLPQPCWWDATEYGLFMTQGNAWPHPAWATGHGADAAGWWADFEVQSKAGPVVQRMRFIPPGRFLMGSPPNEPERYDDERQHAVLLTRGHWLADTACTQALWQAVLGDNPSNFKDAGEDRPVETVSWDDVMQRFLPALNQQLPDLHATLPDEALWEYACRAGTHTPFSFGQGLSTDQANFDGNHPYAGDALGVDRNETVPVKALSANGWGLHQMHGNVWEWCSDGLRPFGDDTNGPTVDPEGPGGPSVGRALRGGGWFNFARFCRSASRRACHPGVRNGPIGFRLARGLPEAARAEPAGIAEPEARRAGVGAPDLRAEGAPRLKGEG